MSRVLVSWFGATDLRPVKGEASARLGPVAQALHHRKYDQRDPITDNDLPTPLERWRKKNAKNFMVPVKDIEENGYDLSIVRYKEAVHEEVTFEARKKIIAKLKKFEAEIAKDLAELEKML